MYNRGLCISDANVIEPRVRVAREEVGATNGAIDSPLSDEIGTKLSRNWDASIGPFWRTGLGLLHLPIIMSAVDPGHHDHLGIGMGTGKDGAEPIDDTTAAAANNLTVGQRRDVSLFPKPRRLLQHPFHSSGPLTRSGDGQAAMDGQG